MKSRSLLAGLGLGMAAAGGARAQTLDAPAAATTTATATTAAVPDATPLVLAAPAANPTALGGTPSRSPFAGLGPAPRTYVGNAADTEGAAVFGKTTAYGVYRTDPKLYAGINLAPGLAIEAGYTNLVNRGSYYAGPEHPEDAAGALGVKGFNTYLAPKVTTTIGDRFEAYGKAGVAYSQNNYHDYHPGMIPASIADTDSGAYVGAGAKYKLTDKASVSAGYERYGETEQKWGNRSNNNSVNAKLKIGF